MIFYWRCFFVLIVSIEFCERLRPLLMNTAFLVMWVSTPPRSDIDFVFSFMLTGLFVLLCLRESSCCLFCLSLILCCITSMIESKFDLEMALVPACRGVIGERRPVLRALLWLKFSKWIWLTISWLVAKNSLFLLKGLVPRGMVWWLGRCDLKPVESCCNVYLSMYSTNYFYLYNFTSFLLEFHGKI